MNVGQSNASQGRSRGDSAAVFQKLTTRCGGGFMVHRWVLRKKKGGVGGGGKKQDRFQLCLRLKASSPLPLTGKGRQSSKTRIQRGADPHFFAALMVGRKLSLLSRIFRLLIAPVDLESRQCLLQAANFSPCDARARDTQIFELAELPEICRASVADLRVAEIEIVKIESEKFGQSVVGNPRAAEDQRPKLP